MSCHPGACKYCRVPPHISHKYSPQVSFGGSAMALHPDAVDVTRDNTISRASVIAWCLAGRGFYAEYHSFWTALGVDHLSVTAFNRSVEELEPHLKAVLDAEMAATHCNLKERNQFDKAKSG